MREDVFGFVGRVELSGFGDYGRVVLKFYDHHIFRFLLFHLHVVGSGHIDNAVEIFTAADFLAVRVGLTLGSFLRSLLVLLLLD